MKEIVKKLTRFFYILAMVLYVSQFSATAQTLPFLHENTTYYTALPTNIGNYNYQYAFYNHISNTELISGQPFQSYAISGDYAFFEGKNRLVAGLNLTNQKLMASPLRDNELAVSVSYQKTFREYKFRIAAQPILYYRALDVGELLYPDQYDSETGDFNSGLPTVEQAIPGKTKIGLNINAGVALTRYFNRFYSELGFNVRNILPEAYTANSVVVPQYFQFLVSSKIFYNLTDKQVLVPHLLYNFTTEVNEIIIGADLQHQLGYNSWKINAFQLGAFASLRSQKFPNQMVFNVGAKIQKLHLAFAYAYNLNTKARKIGSFNSYQITLGFVGISPLLENYSVPCEIY